jgi:ATP adenylyltransferase
MGSRVSGGEQREARRFSWVLAGAHLGPDPNFDIDLAQLQSVAVIPTRGALTPEWLLVVPRQPCLSVAELAPAARRDVMRCAQLAANAVANVAGSAVLFEHGAGKPRSPNGCGVDQAHLHVVGLPPDFAYFTKKGTSNLAWVAADWRDPWKNLVRGSDYILMSVAEIAWVATIQTPTSQLLRRKVAEFLHMPDDWDYRQHPNVENAKRTTELFSRAFRAGPD